MPAMIVLKQTPAGCKLMPLSEVSGSRGLPLMRNHPQAQRVGEVMDFLVVKLREFRGRRVALHELWGALMKQYGQDFFPDVKLLSSTGATPARLLIKE